MRLEPLGLDRHYNRWGGARAWLEAHLEQVVGQGMPSPARSAAPSHRSPPPPPHACSYWLLPAAALDSAAGTDAPPLLAVERHQLDGLARGGSGGGGSGQLPAPAAAPDSSAWKVGLYASSTQLHVLLLWLNQQGTRERALAAEVRHLLEAHQDAPGLAPLHSAASGGLLLPGGEPAEPDPLAAQVEALRRGLLDFEGGLAPASRDPLRASEARRRAWRGMVGRAAGPGGLMSCLLALEGMLAAEWLKPHWRPWACPAPHPAAVGEGRGGDGGGRGAAARASLRACLCSTPLRCIAGLDHPPPAPLFPPGGPAATLPAVALRFQALKGALKLKVGIKFNLRDANLPPAVAAAAAAGGGGRYTLRESKPVKKPWWESADLDEGRSGRGSASAAPLHGGGGGESRAERAARREAARLVSAELSEGEEDEEEGGPSDDQEYARRLNAELNAPTRHATRHGAAWGAGPLQRPGGRPRARADSESESVEEEWQQVRGQDREETGSCCQCSPTWLLCAG